MDLIFSISAKGLEVLVSEHMRFFNSILDLLLLLIKVVLVLLLEESINDDWIHADIGNILTGLPLRMKAVEEASPSSLALRILLLDRSLLYNRVDKKRYKKTSKSRK